MSAQSAAGEFEPINQQHTHQNGVQGELKKRDSQPDVFASLMAPLPPYVMRALATLEEEIVLSGARSTGRITPLSTTFSCPWLIQIFFSPLMYKFPLVRTLATVVVI